MIRNVKIFSFIPRLLSLRLHHAMLSSQNPSKEKKEEEKSLEMMWNLVECGMLGIQAAMAVFYCVWQSKGAGSWHKTSNEISDCKRSRGRRYPELCGCGIFENWNFRHSLVIRTSFSSLICIPNVNYAETHRRLSFSLRSQTIQRRNWLSQKLFTFALMSSKVSSCYSI